MQKSNMTQGTLNRNTSLPETSINTGIKRPRKDQIGMFTSITKYTSHCIDNTSSAVSIIQAVFPHDKTKIEWLQNSQKITVTSSMGIKSTLGFFEALSGSVQLKQKVLYIVKQGLNTYDDHFHYIGKTTGRKNLSQGTSIGNNYQIPEAEIVRKKYRIKQFEWTKCPVTSFQEEESSQKFSQGSGFSIRSTDLNAELILLADLFTVEVRYLQYLETEVEKDSSMGTHKYRTDQKTLVNDKNIGVSLSKVYVYVKQSKVFSIFNIPARWLCPINHIWTHLNVNRLIKHEFMYTDLDEEGVPYDKCTKMPEVIDLNNRARVQESEKTAEQLKMEMNCEWTILQDCRTEQEQCDQNSRKQVIAWFNFDTGVNIMDDGKGFWINYTTENQLLYKFKNERENQAKYSRIALPQTIRFEGRPQIRVHELLKMFQKGLQHNQRSRNIQNSSSVTKKGQIQVSKDSTQLIHEQAIGQVGYVKIYGNGMIVGKFIDKSLLTLKGDKISILTSDGETYQILGSQVNRNVEQNRILNEIKLASSSSSGLQIPWKRKYNCHCLVLLEEFDKTFNVQQYWERKTLQEQMDNLIATNNAYLNVCEAYQKD